MITAIVNGESREFHSSANIREMVEELGMPPSVVLVEHNGLALRRGEWEAALLAEGDRIEIIRVAAGG